jgi:hypothetical protein
VIYKINRDLKVARVTEGLAPGPLQPLSGDYLDSHSLGQAADFDIEIPKDKRNPDDIRKIAMKNGMNGFVTYDAFFHMDGRTGLQPSSTCVASNYSQVRRIAAHLSFRGLSKLPQVICGKTLQRITSPLGSVTKSMCT